MYAKLYSRRNEVRNMFLYTKEYRKKSGISVPKMSAPTGIPIRTIEDLEKRGDCLVSNALKIADVLGVKPDDFLSPPAGD